MLPIAVLPAAGLLFRLGQPDLLGHFRALRTVAAVCAGAGSAIFASLPLLFATGIAIGSAKDADGSTALTAVVGYVVLKGVSSAMAPVVLPGQSSPGLPATIDYGVLGGIITGLIASSVWQRFHCARLPPWLGIFAGPRCALLVIAIVMTSAGVLLSLAYPLFERGLVVLSQAIGSNPVLGGALFGLANRLLVIVGLPQVLNAIPWFLLGSYDGVHGDLNRFFAGDPSAGTFMTGFFPIFMFGLPAAATAVWHEARPEERRRVGETMLSAAIVAFTTGVTEPLEYTFIFVAWPLYLVHAVLTGTAMAIVNALGIHDGFTFSAGLIDYAINFGQATKPWLLLPLGFGYAAVYYCIFRLMIRKLDLDTPGRRQRYSHRTDFFWPH